MSTTKRRNLTRNEVFEAWKALRGEGRREVSGLEVREKTVGGSLTTIYRYIREFKSEESKAAEVAPAVGAQPKDAAPVAPPIPQARLDAGVNFLKAYWDSAAAQAKMVFEQHEQEFSNTLAEQEKLLNARQKETERLLAEIEKSERELQDSETETTQLKESNLKLSGELQGVREQFSLREKEFRGKADTQNKELAELRSEANGLREKMSVVGELAALKDQFSVREKELKERLLGQEAELVALRKDSNELRERAIKAEAQLAHAAGASSKN